MNGHSRTYCFVLFGLKNCRGNASSIFTKDLLTKQRSLSLGFRIPITGNDGVGEVVGKADECSRHEQIIGFASRFTAIKMILLFEISEGDAKAFVSQILPHRIIPIKRNFLIRTAWFSIPLETPNHQRISTVIAIGWQVLEEEGDLTTPGGKTLLISNWMGPFPVMCIAQRSLLLHSLSVSKRLPACGNMSIICHLSENGRS